MMKCVLADGNKKILVFNLENGKVEKLDNRIIGVAYQPKGNQFSSVDSSGNLLIWG